MIPSADDDSNGESEKSDRRRGRRELIATGATLGTAGCLGFFDGSSGNDTSSQSEEYTTVPGTTTFAQVTGERTPYPSVQPVTIGSGQLLSVYFDYAQQSSVDWWNETFPQIEDLVEGDEIRLTLGFYPVPTSRWSVMIPCALLAVKNQAGNAAAVEFHERIVGEDYAMSVLTDTADAVGADPTGVERAARDRLRRNQVFASRSFAVDRGIDSPPGAIAVDETLPDASAETIRAAYTTETDG